MLAGLAGTARETMTRTRIGLHESLSGQVATEGRGIIADLEGVADVMAPEHLTAGRRLGLEGLLPGDVDVALAAELGASVDPDVAVAGEPTALGGSLFERRGLGLALRRAPLAIGHSGRGLWHGGSRSHGAGLVDENGFANAGRGVPRDGDELRGGRDHLDHDRGGGWHRKR